MNANMSECIKCGYNGSIGKESVCQRCEKEQEDVDRYAKYYKLDRTKKQRCRNARERDFS